MRFRRRPHEAGDSPPDSPDANASGASGGLRERAERLCAIADRHIDEALSNDPDLFLQQNRQLGGQ